MTGRLIIIALAALLAVGGIATAFAVGDSTRDDAPQSIEMRKEDPAEPEVVEDDDDDGDGAADDDSTATDADTTSGDDRTDASQTGDSNG